MSPHYTQFITICKHNILTHSHGNIIDIKKVNYMIDIDIFKKLLSKKSGRLEGFGIKVMPCWLRLWSQGNQLA